MSASNADGQQDAVFEVLMASSRPEPDTVAYALGRPAGVGLLVQIGVAVACVFATANASAAVIEGVGTALRLLTPLVLVGLFKGRTTQLLAENLFTVGILAALALVAAFMWRIRDAAGRRRSNLLRRPREADSAFESPFGHGVVELPAHVDRSRLQTELRHHFYELQAAWDGSKRIDLSRLTTPTMLEELRAARTAGSGLPQRTEVVGLDLQVLAFEAVGQTQVAYVEYFGTVRESGSGQDAPFRELWMLTREQSTAAAGSWRLARHQALL